MEQYAVVGCKPWSYEIFRDRIQHIPGKWIYLDHKDYLSRFIAAFNPKYVFFLHWNHFVPKEITNRYECVCFHMTDVPYGRGGSPLQNLIERGHKETKITALRMVEQMDAGPVYCKRNLSLDGSAEEIYRRAMVTAAGMVEEIISGNCSPSEQIGEVVEFKRRKPEQSRIYNIANCDKLHDHIRMLDAEGYPKAFIELDGFRFEFGKSKHNKNAVTAEVTITRP